MAPESTKNKCLRTKGAELEDHSPETRGNRGHTGEEKVIDLKNDGESHSLWRRSGAYQHRGGRGTLR